MIKNLSSDTVIFADHRPNPTNIELNRYFNSKQSERSESIQWLRFGAALFVVLYHASIYVQIRTGDATFLKVFSDSFGLIGVAIFFAISGWLMSNLVRKTDKWTFLLHRIIRIYPMYFLVSIPYIFLYVKAPSVDWISLSLIPAGNSHSYVLGVEWTLLFECTFYVIMFFISAFGLVRYLEIIAGLWLLAIAITNIIATQNMPPFLPELPFMAASAAFAGGLLIPYLSTRGCFHPICVVFISALSLMSLSFSLGTDRIIGAINAVFIVGMVVSGQRSDQGKKPLFARVATKFGDWSYATYLSHMVVITIIYNAAKSGPHFKSWLAAIIATLAITVLLGITDVWIYKKLKKGVDGLSSSHSAILGALYLLLFFSIGSYQWWISH